MSVLYEILVATAFSLLLSPTPEMSNDSREMEEVEQVSPVETEENASEGVDCKTENPGF